MLGSDVDTSYLGEIQGIESLVLVPALVGTPALTLWLARPNERFGHQVSQARDLVEPTG